MTYNYLISDTLNNAVDILALNIQINESDMTVFPTAVTVGDDIQIEYESTLSGVDEQKLDLLIAQHDGNADQIEEMINQYIGHENEGISYYRRFRAKRKIDLDNELYTAQQVFDLETFLKPVSDELVRGNWLTAQSIQGGLTPDTGIYSQAMHDELSADIAAYITANYS